MQSKLLGPTHAMLKIELEKRGPLKAPFESAFAKMRRLDREAEAEKEILEIYFRPDRK